ncbi:TPA: hypothetical protein EYP26_03235 [Candidatus Bathyarchaeota archaeon]|nr:hypothetical protein [Candidatus Bathyarchaeota archaeon]
MIFLTTSRRPTQRIRSFVKDLSRALPKVRRFNRGKLSLKELEGLLLKERAKLVLVSRWKGGPGKIELLSAGKGELRREPPIVCLKGVKLRREYGTPKSFTVKAITIDDERTRELEELARRFSRFFELPLLEEGEGQLSSLHFRLCDFEGIWVGVTCPAKRRAVGPSFTIKHLIWSF